MSSPLFAEDSNAITLAPILSQTIKQLDDNADKYDYIMAFLVTIMAESGYRLPCLYDKNTDTWSKEMAIIPTDWKSVEKNIYEMDFLLHTRKEVGIRLIGIPIGDWIVLNMMSKESYRSIKTRSIAVNAAKHVNMFQNDLGKYWHLKELALTFKNNLLAPLHGEIMMAIGLASPSLMGIPLEIKENISKMLDEESRKNLKKTCKEL